MADRAPLRVTVVGCAPAYTLRPGRPSSCYLVEAEGTAILLDLGQGSFSALGPFIDPATLDAVFVSHLHPDHHADLVPLRHYLRYACDPPATVALHAPAELRSRYDLLLGEPGFLDGLPGSDVSTSITQVGALAVDARPVTHATHSHAFRVTRVDGAGPGLVYSGDCGRADDLLRLVRPADTLLCEASWGSSEAPAEGGALHLTAAQAADVAKRTGAARLILTHVLDERDPDGALVQAQRLFDGPVALAAPGMILEVA